ncbi:laminin subunit alpha-3 [Mugil cephalus]|uniref:laminin subunit alpha-3 n=1 Tax=Mugil cephalus TaxID=48193 RepID=UPI001FB7A544|nr:laminin subunit alpha-3 [Mugil cephalus]
MQWNTHFLCVAAWLGLLYFAQICPSTQKHPKCGHDRRSPIQQKRHSMKKFCDPSFSNQTAGAITQKCSSGFYRERDRPLRGQCVPCSCNGLSNECDEHTGNCVNCQFNSTGDRCERCKEGYHGNAANRTCLACPCPSTQNNFALACMDVGSGVVECLCKRGYSGATCERCALGYYGNPMVHGDTCKPCNCKNSSLNFCDAQTGECVTAGNSSCGDHCHECDSCDLALLVDLEKMGDSLVWVKQQLQNISRGPASISRLNKLNASVSEINTPDGRYGNAVRQMDPKVEELEAPVDVVRYNLGQLTDESFDTASHLEKVIQFVTETKLKANNLLTEAEDLVLASQDLMRQLSEVKPVDSVSLSENQKSRMVEEAQPILQEMRERGCTVHRDKAGGELQEAHKLLDFIKNNMTAPGENSQADSLTSSHSSLRDVTGLLSNAEDAVDRTHGLNLKSSTTLQQLQRDQAQLQRDQSTLLLASEMTGDLLKNITDIFPMLAQRKEELENRAAQMDGAQMEVFKKLNSIFQITTKVDSVTRAEEHAEELNGVAIELQQVLHDAFDSTELFSRTEPCKAVETAETDANKSREAADQAATTVKERDLTVWAKLLKDNSTHLWTQANNAQSQLRTLSHTVDALEDHVNKRKEKGATLRVNISTVSDNIKKIKRDDTKVLIESVKTAASAANSTVSNIKERLRYISLEVEGITSTNVSVIKDNMLTDTDQALKSFNGALPDLIVKLVRVEALGRKTSPSANMTESIRRIKDIIEETRNFVNRLSLATTFNGKGHVELHPPENLEDIKAFTAVDLLLNRHPSHPSKADRRRKRRQDRHRDANFFVFYLGNKDASGDYVGMAIRRAMLICVYKLGGVVHEVETSQITVTSINSANFDRVIFHRVYQDVEVNITQNFTSEQPVSLPPTLNLPDTTTGVLDLHPGSVVFYVGGYPEDFTPPVELRFPKYRGAMKLSFVNDNPVCLFNYKHAVNMEAKQPAAKIPRTEVSDYYEGTGYRMVFIKKPDMKRRLLFKFHTRSQETNALLFYIGDEDSFFCVFVERGLLVLQGQQAGEELRVQSAERVSLMDKQIAVRIADKFTVHCGRTQISTNYIKTNYRSYYIGGLPVHLRQRHNITAPPLRGCVDHLNEDAQAAEYNKTIGVSDGCPASLLGVRTATLYSALSMDSLFAGDEGPLRVSLGFRSTDSQGILLKSGSQGSASVRDLQLSLDDGFVVFNSYNYILKSDKRYSDGAWHYISAAARSTGLELSIDNINVIQRQSPEVKLRGGKFKGCIANLYARRPGQSFIPTDLSSLSQMGESVLGQCSLHPPHHTELSTKPPLKRPQTHQPIQAPAGSPCRHQGNRDEYQLFEAHSWLSYRLPQQDLNHRPHFSLDLKTNSSKGLILHVAGRGVVPVLALYMANGKIKMSLGQNRIIQHKQKSNDWNWHRVEFSVEFGTFHLLVDGFRVSDGHLPNKEGASLDLHKPVYLGGDPQRRTTKGHDIPTNSVLGCMRDFRMNEVAIGAPEASHKTLPCLDGLTETGTYFGGGHIVLDNYFTVGPHFVLTFELRPRYLTGLLFHVQSDNKSLNVFLMENKVGVKVNDGNGVVSVSVAPRKSLCDGKFHVVTVSKQRKVLKLEVDSVSRQKEGPVTSTPPSAALESLYIGGMTNKNRAPVSSPFVGCLRNVKLDERSVSFEAESRVVGPVSIAGCPAR